MNGMVGLSGMAGTAGLSGTTSNSMNNDPNDLNLFVAVVTKVQLPAGMTGPASNRCSLDMYAVNNGAPSEHLTCR